MKVVLVTVAEGPGVQADVAFTAGALRSRNLVPVELPTDFCTDEEPFQADLRALEPVAVIFPYQAEFREIVSHLSAEARRGLGSEVPVVVTGDALLRDALDAELAEGVQLLPGDLGRCLADRLVGDEGGDPRHADIAADLEYSACASVAADPLWGALFLEPATAPLWATRAGRNALPPTALLARLEAPVSEEVVPLQPAAALAPLDGYGSALERIEWWDRHADDSVLARAAEVAARGVRQSARFLPVGHDPDALASLPASGIDRVVFEVDRVSDAEPLPGSAAAAHDLRPWVECARSLGLEVGILAVIGVPGENENNGDERLAELRSLQPDHLRCVPFEPTGGREIRDFLEQRGHGESLGRRWNRELHRSLEGEGAAAEIFIRNWALAHHLLAEIETRGSPAL